MPITPFNLNLLFGHNSSRVHADRRKAFSLWPLSSRNWTLLRGSHRSRANVALEFYPILFNYIVIKVGAAKGAANRLADDSADHEERNKRELVGHLKNNQNGSNRCPDHSPKTRAHSCYGKSNPVTRPKIDEESA